MISPNGYHFKNKYGIYEQVNDSLNQTGFRESSPSIMRKTKKSDLPFRRRTLSIAVGSEKGRLN